MVARVRRALRPGLRSLDWILWAVETSVGFPAWVTLQGSEGSCTNSRGGSRPSPLGLPLPSSCTQGSRGWRRTFRDGQSWPFHVPELSAKAGSLDLPGHVMGQPLPHPTPHDVRAFLWLPEKKSKTPEPSCLCFVVLHSQVWCLFC